RRPPTPTPFPYTTLFRSEGARPYINVWVARADDADNPAYAKIVELFKETEVQDALVAQSGGTAVLANQTAEELQGYLADIQADRSEEHTSELQSRENLVC